MGLGSRSAADARKRRLLIEYEGFWKVGGGIDCTISSELFLYGIIVLPSCYCNNNNNYKESRNDIKAAKNDIKDAVDFLNRINSYYLNRA